MKVALLIVGALVLLYWCRSMLLPAYDRPLYILRNGGLILATGIACIVIGFIL